MVAGLVEQPAADALAPPGFDDEQVLQLQFPAAGMRPVEPVQKAVADRPAFAFGDQDMPAGRRAQRVALEQGGVERG